MVDTAYGRTFVRICGPAGAKPLVLLHGAGLSSLYWVNNVGVLSKHFRIFAIDDLYGSGRSIYVPKTIKDSGDYVNWLNELFDALELGNDINMVGHSYGGWQISQYALQSPERLNRIVVIAPGGTVLSLRAGYLVRVALAVVLQSQFFSRKLLFWLYEDSAKKDKAVIDNILALSGFRRYFKFKRLPMPTILNDGELKSIRIPTFFLFGENEKLYLAHSAVKRLNTVAPQIKTEIIPDAGHDLLFAQTEMVNGKLLEFLTGTRTSTLPAQNAAARARE
jgi:pimeloyl-ACP methyl ester carboxylesterase